MAPTPVMLRRAVAPIRLGRVRVRAGDRIVIATHTCARALGPLDPEVMRAAAAPAEPRRIVFGAGPHTCIGAPLALAEIRALARTVLGAQPLRIMRRQAARGVLIPTYRVLEVARR
jgi:cytochrome P450